MSKSEGFSLIELLIVVAVIGIIAALAVPNLVQSRKAIASVRNLVTAQITYDPRSAEATLDRWRSSVPKTSQTKWPEGRLRRFSCRQRIDRIQRVSRSSSGQNRPKYLSKKSSSVFVLLNVCM